MIFDAGQLLERVAVLELGYDEEKNLYQWQVKYMTNAEATVSGKNNLFSSVGIGARDVEFTVRHNPALVVTDAILWQNRHCFITAIVPVDRLLDRVRCALVQVAACTANKHLETAGPSFPAALTEKYVGHETVDLMAVNETTYVLVTPKAINLTRGSLVEVNGRDYHVLLGHYLDSYKNEYELQLVEDL